MIAAAESRIDVQTFLVKPDKAGSLISLALIDAADRGVAVRLLVDDVFTTASDDQLAYLSAHPRISVRLFNPLSRRSTTAINYLLDFKRVNRRMHNKAFIVDGSIAIVGGRNLADEYYRIDTATEFADFDLFMAGPAVEELSAAFSLFWSDKWSVPVEALRNDATDVDLAQVKAVLEERRRAGIQGIYRRAVGSRYLADVSAGRVQRYFGHAHVVTDPPAKLRQPVHGGTRPLAENLMQDIAKADTQVTIVTPYFVPEDWGAKMFSDLAARGVRVRIITNSLAANNHAYVHGGYMRHRKPLLASGVEIYEVRADAPELVGDVAPGAGPRMTMHTKLVIIDDRTSFVGSLNFDPRSIKLNTEMGLFIDDLEIARAFLAAIEEDLTRYTFRVSVDADGDLLWTWRHDDVEQRYRSEPQATVAKKAVAATAAALPIEGQL
ncbi:phospholipase D family protein [Tropicimonas sp. TH_r6]|uniref:phospholipase D family protein n=1 Tax=Tropicimonas sp. TH_r6 TaxID=3082085 RepID=UPI0029559209|nr:phospholipase D family protein [Tropicimonas sp. TH_r6]MDV7145803.1 phospholipase D family protein [Tropicimonas sp. TH_r6]